MEQVYDRRDRKQANVRPGLRHLIKESQCVVAKYFTDIIGLRTFTVFSGSLLSLYSIARDNKSLQNSARNGTVATLYGYFPPTLEACIQTFALVILSIGILQLPTVMRSPWELVNIVSIHAAISFLKVVISDIFRLSYPNAKVHKVSLAEGSILYSFR